MERLVVVVVTVPDEEQGARIGRLLVEERLAACVNVMGGIRSIYRWKGEICDEGETLLWVKTRFDLLPRLQDRLRQVHPYEVPEVIAMDISQGLPEYLSWVARETGGGA